MGEGRVFTSKMSDKCFNQKCVKRGENIDVCSRESFSTSRSVVILCREVQLGYENLRPLLNYFLYKIIFL